MTLPMAPRALLLAALAAGPFVAQAQDLTVTVTKPTDIGIDNCETKMQDNIFVSGTADSISQTDFEVWLTWAWNTTQCGRDVLETCVAQGGVSSGRCGCLDETSAGDTSASVSDQATVLGNMLPSDICSQGESTELKFYVEFEDQDSDEGSVTSSDPVTVKLDFEAPDAPPTPSATPAESAIEVTITEPSDTSDIDSYEVCVLPTSGVSGSGSTGDSLTSTEVNRDGYTDCETVTDVSQAVRLDGLTNGTSYSIVAASFDSAGNRSKNSTAVVATPEEVLDFAEYYSEVGRRGSVEEGGCSAAGDAPAGMLILGLLGLLGLRRKS